MKIVIQECRNLITESSNVIKDLRNTYPLVVKTYETSFAYYSLRRRVLRDLNHYVEMGELNSRVKTYLLEKIGKVDRYEFYSQQREFGYIVGFNCCYRQKNMTPYFSFDAIKLDKYCNHNHNHDDNQQDNVAVVEMMEEEIEVPVGGSRRCLMCLWRRTRRRRTG